MSVYGGFATRGQETTYNKALYNMVCLLQHRISKIHSQGIVSSYFIDSYDENKFNEYFKRFYLKLYELDEVKHLSPRFSYAVKDLATLLGIYRELSNLPTSSSILSYKTEFNGALPKPKPKTNLKASERVLRKLNNTVCITTPKDYLKNFYKFNTDNPIDINRYAKVKKYSKYKIMSQYNRKPSAEETNKKGDILFQSLIKSPLKSMPKQVRAKTVVRPRANESNTNRMMKMIVNNYGRKLSGRRDRKHVKTEVYSSNRRFNSID